MQIELMLIYNLSFYLSQVVDVLQLIFDPQDNRLPTLEDLVLCDLFRNIDLRELRGPSVSVKLDMTAM